MNHFFELKSPRLMKNESFFYRNCRINESFLTVCDPPYRPQRHCHPQTPSHKLPHQRDLNGTASPSASFTTENSSSLYLAPMRAPRPLPTIITGTISRSLCVLRLVLLLFTVLFLFVAMLLYSKISAVMAVFLVFDRCVKDCTI